MEPGERMTTILGLLLIALIWAAPFLLWEMGLGRGGPGGGDSPYCSRGICD